MTAGTDLSGRAREAICSLSPSIGQSPVSVANRDYKRAMHTRNKEGARVRTASGTQQGTDRMSSLKPTLIHHRCPAELLVDSQPFVRKVVDGKGCCRARTSNLSSGALANHAGSSSSRVVHCPNLHRDGDGAVRHGHRCGSRNVDCRGGRVGCHC